MITPAQHKRLRYGVRRLLRLCGLSDPRAVTQACVDEFVVLALREGYAPSSINASIDCLRALTGKNFSGHLAVKSRPPKIVPLGDLGKTFRVAQQKRNLKVARFLKWSYFLGLRLQDVLDIRREQIDFRQGVVIVDASKTGKVHAIPIHPCLRNRMQQVERPFWMSQKYVRKYIRRYAEMAGVPPFTPQMIRTLALTNYELAHPGAGAILGGHSLGRSDVTWRHYLDATQILRKAQLGLAVPDEFLDKRECRRRTLERRQLTLAFDRLSDRDREAVLRMVSAFAN